MSLFHAARARLRLMARRSSESRIDEEIRFHVEMEAERLVRQERVEPGEARRRALATFGGVQKHREALCDGRGTAWFSGLSLDFKLGFRMLVKYPGLTIVGALAIGFGIWFGAVSFELRNMLVNPRLTLPDGDRIVMVRNLDLKTSDFDERITRDYLLWRQTLRSITDLGAYRDFNANLVGADRSAQSVVAAEITPSAFRLAPDRPLLGRVLNASDEQAGGPSVVLIGYDVWQTRFAGDSQVVGRTVQIGTDYATVVGVMPDGFRFPAAHGLWMPLRADAFSGQPRSGPSITVFGKLAPGLSLEAAQAELTNVGLRMAAEYPTTHAQLTPRVVPYAEGYLNVNPSDARFMLLIDVFTIMLVGVVCSTVALLLFARAASRDSEIVVRSALGASRGRIMAQLFAEALVLGGVAAIVGLVAAQMVLTRWGQPFLENNIGLLPFWFKMRISPATVLYASALAVFAAVIAGVGPARKITRGLGSRLKAQTAGGGGVSFGGVWTAVIVAQVALTVTFPAVVKLVGSEIDRISNYDVGFAAHEYLGMRLDPDFPVVDSAQFEAARAATAVRFAASVEALRRRLESEADVAGVTFASSLPRWYHREQMMEVLSLPGNPAWEVATATVDPSYFEVLNTPVKAGRGFTGADLSPDSRAVIVDDNFVRIILQGRNPIGHRIRLSPGRSLDPAAADLPWYEIVGVVRDLGMTHAAQPQPAAGVYRPAVPVNMQAVHMVVHVRGDPLAVGHRARSLATIIDPTLRISDVKRLDEVTTSLIWDLGLWLRIIIGLAAITLLLSLAGIYAVLSYIVARRTREIGVRVALGANPQRIITSIFRRPLKQVVLGVGTGALLVVIGAVVLSRTEQFKSDSSAAFTLGDGVLLVAYAVVMLAICFLACIVPTWRALNVQPTEALRAE